MGLGCCQLWGLVSCVVMLTVVEFGLVLVLGLELCSGGLWVCWWWGLLLVLVEFTFMCCCFSVSSFLEVCWILGEPFFVFLWCWCVGEVVCCGVVEWGLWLWGVGFWQG